MKRPIKGGVRIESGSGKRPPLEGRLLKSRAILDLSLFTFFFQSASGCLLMKTGAMMSVGIFLTALYSPKLWAKAGIALGSGYGVAQIVPIRLGFQKEFEKKWPSPEHWPIVGYWEANFYSMNGRAANALNNHRLTAGALAGVFRFEREKKLMQGWPYFEIGIGASYLSKKEIGGKNLGIHFQFEDRVGMGLKFGEKRQYDIGYKFFHFSNAYLGHPNHGLNLHMVVLGYWFQ